MISTELHHFRIERGKSGIVTVWIDVASRSMNVFHDSVIEELEVVIGELEREFQSVSHTDTTGLSHSHHESVAKAILFRSAKASGFFAGADVHQIAGLQSRGEVDAVLTRGQNVFSRIERLPVPTVAAIHGACLGGGLEFALACRHRIAMESRTTRLGLPEVQLGLIPGWGGTQRLPKLIGLPAALPLILQGKKLTAAASLKAGLVDAVSDEAVWDESIEAYISDVCFGNVPRQTAASVEFPSCLKRSWQVRGPISMKQQLMRAAADSRFGRWLVCRTAERKVRRSSEHYPALPAALRAVRAAFMNQSAGFAVEREEFAKLIELPTCRNLLSLFFWRERARSITTAVSGQAEPTVTSGDRERHLSSDRHMRCLRGSESSESTTAGDNTHFETDQTPVVRTIGVIGAGAMGAGIGQLAALKGFRVVLKELTVELASAGLARVSGLLNDMVVKKRLSSQEREEVLSRVSVTDSFSALADCDVVIEAVVEEMDVKQTVFNSLDAVLKSHALILSNTSALSVTKMAAGTSRTDRVAGLHFFNPVHRMDLVEVVRAAETSDVTVSTLLKLVKNLGKTPIVTTDAPGFLVNRVLFPYIGEAVRMVLECHDCRELDRAVKRFGMPMGPIELIDHVGIDVAQHVAATLDDVLPESGNIIRVLGQMVSQGWTGRKSGRGFYAYAHGKRTGVNAELLTLVHADAARNGKSGDSKTAVGTYLSDGLTDVERRLIYPMINEVGFCMQEGVVAESWMADLAMILGTGFAPFRGGPMTLAKNIGHPALLNNLHVLAARFGERFKPSAWLVNLKVESQPGDSVPSTPTLV